MPAGAGRAREALQLAAPAKINLYLGVHPQIDAEGYHRVDSVMAALELADLVELSPAPALSVACDPAVPGPPEKNSAWRAATALARELGREPAVRIRIEKRIPVQAGLGGPSSDAAAVLRGICALWDVDPADPRVAAVARGIGADVPFFLGRTPAYLAGRGDELVEAFALPAPLPVALVKPQAAGVSTPAAYRAFDTAPTPLPPLEPLLSALRTGRTAKIPALAANNLAPAACELEPQIGAVLAWLGAQPGVLAANVCGSGACSFALCESDEAAARVTAEARVASGGRWWACATRCATGR